MRLWRNGWSLYNIRLYVLCLMVNHFHLVLETPEANLGRFMHSLTTAYTVYYNLRYHRHGHLTQGRYGAKLVEGGPASPTCFAEATQVRRLCRAGEYLLALSRYVHLNPVHIKAAEQWSKQEKIRYLRGYRWSTYPSYIGAHKGFDFVDSRPVLGEMGGRRKERPRRYRAFVESSLKGPDEKFKIALKESPRSIGSDAFRVWVDELYQQLVQGGDHSVEDISFRRTTEPLSSDMILNVLCEIFDVERDAFFRRRRNSLLRGVAARLLCRYGGMTQREVAALLGMSSGAAISQQLRKVTEELPKNRRLRRLVKQGEEKLHEIR